MLVDCDGEHPWYFPNEWTDEMIWEALEYGEACYRLGEKSGKVQKLFEIKKALEIL